MTEALDVIESGKPKTLEFGVADETAWKVGLSCGGTIRVFVEKVGLKCSLDILEALNTERAARRAAVVVTNQESGAQRLVTQDKIARRSAEGCARSASALGQERHRGDAEGKVFLTVHVPPTRLVITGAVHISQALAPIASLLGYDVTIVDPRTAFATPERFPGREGDRRMARRGAAAARHRPLHGLRRADARSQDRRSGAHACARARVLLHRRARLEEDSCAAASSG